MQSAFEVIESDDVKSEVVLDEVKLTDPENNEKNESKVVPVIDDFESGDSESTDDSVNTSELPELIEIESPEEPKPKEKEPEETNDDAPIIPEWEDILGTGRLHIKRISAGSGEQVNRTSSIKIQISVPSVPFDIKFGSNECELKHHSTLEVLLGDQIDLVPGAIELALHGLAAGGEIAIRSHKDLRG